MLGYSSRAHRGHRRVVRQIASAFAEMFRVARAFVFDFDGTLVDSNPIKSRAFEACFADVGEKRLEVLAYCRGNHHVPRDAKFRHVYEEILGLPYTLDVAVGLHERFAAATTRQIIAVPEVPGAAAFLRGARAHRVMALLSSTPHDLLVHIVSERGWRELFDAVQGAPVDKAAWLHAYRIGRGFDAAEVVFFGDTPEDAASADAAGCRFVAVGHGMNSGRTEAVLEDFRELADLVGGDTDAGRA